MIKTPCQLVKHMEQYYAERLAFQYDKEGEVHQVSYQTYITHAKRFAGWLKKTFPDMEGKHIGLLAENSYPYMVSFLGILLAKGVAVPLNAEESWDTIRYEVDFADVTALFTDGEYEKKEPLLKTRYASMLWNMEEIAGALHSGSCLEKGTEEEETEEEGTEEEMQRLMVIMFTSGTTGRSKGVMMSGKSLFSNLDYAVSQCEQLGKQAGTPVLKALLIASMCHMAGMGAYFAWLSMGNVINISSSVKYLYRDLKRMESDYCSTVVPVILKAWYKDLKKGRREKLGSLKTIMCGAATIDPGMFQEFEKNGIHVVQSYGMTEICGGGTVNASSDIRKLKSVGQLGNGCELKIEQGEICFKSDTMMMGYYKDPKATREAIRDGWFYTGDLGYVDEDGFLYLTGRKKNLIILSSGENVSPEELELVLQKNPVIEEVCVKEKGDRICAEIFCPASQKEAVCSYVKEVNRGLPVYKQMTCVEFREEPFPRTASGKIRRKHNGQGSCEE